MKRTCLIVVFSLLLSVGLIQASRTKEELKEKTNNLWDVVTEKINLYSNSVSEDTIKNAIEYHNQTSTNLSLLLAAATSCMEVIHEVAVELLWWLQFIKTVFVLYMSSVILFYIVKFIVFVLNLRGNQPQRV